MSYDNAATKLLNMVDECLPRKTFNIVQDKSQRNTYEVIKQQNDTTTIFIVINSQITNLTQNPLHLVNASIINPKLKGVITHHPILVKDKGLYGVHSIRQNNTCFSLIQITVTISKWLFCDSLHKKYIKRKLNSGKFLIEIEDCHGRKQLKEFTLASL